VRGSSTRCGTRPRGLPADGGDLSAEDHGECSDDERKDETRHTKTSWSGKAFRRDGRVFSTRRREVSRRRPPDERTSARCNQAMSAIRIDRDREEPEEHADDEPPTSGPNTRDPGRMGAAPSGAAPVRASHVKRRPPPEIRANPAAPPST